MCKPDIDLVLDVHPVERPARAYRNTSRAPRGRRIDPHVQVFLLDEHLGQGRYPILAAMHCPHSVFDIGHCTVIHCDTGGVSLVDQ